MMEGVAEILSSAQAATVIGAAAPIVVGIVEMLKALGLPSRWAPLAAIGCGIAICAGAAFAAGSDIAAHWFSASLNGVVAGLVASGLYSGSKNITNR